MTKHIAPTERTTNDNDGVAFVGTRVELCALLVTALNPTSRAVVSDKDMQIANRGTATEIHKWFARGWEKYPPALP